MKKRSNHTKPSISLWDLAQGGAPVDLSGADAHDEHPDIEIELVGGVFESRIFDLPTGLAGYTLDIVITNHSSKTIYCRDVELRLPWEDSFFNWLADPREAGRVEYYCFPNGGGPEYDPDIVLNHLLLRNGAITGRPLSGLLLGTGRPMPHDLRQGSMLNATLVLTSFDHIEYSATVSLAIDRQKKVAIRSRRKYDLFGEPVGLDIGPAIGSGGPRSGDSEVGRCIEDSQAN